jgi:acyl-CoA reductase-like NAD-dependent aldehyde dehydrogenase/nicotinamidase-related amidase
MTSLLLLVDLQNDYLAAPGLEPSAGATARQAAALLEGWRELDLPVAHVWTTVSRADDRRMPHWKRQGRWLCEEGTPGHAPPAGLEPAEGEAVMHKTSFGGVFAAGGEVDRLLAARDVRRVVVAGVHLHGCVRQAVLEAYERDGLEVWVAEDATASDDSVHAAITRRYLEARAARFLPVDAVLGGLGARANGGPPGRGGAVRDAAERCRAAQAHWAETGQDDRGRLLGALAERIESEAGPLAREMAQRVGKPVRYGTAEVLRAAQMLRAVAGHAAAAAGEPAADGAQLRRRPLGVVALITPWNSPVYIALGKLAPALAYGNAVLWKPAPAAQAVSERVAALIAEAGFPDGLVSLVEGGRREAERAMADPAVAAVTLTGGALAGYSAQETCARRHIPLQAELGGNNAALVWPDADLGVAAAELAEGAFALAGQRCTANRRMVVHRDVRDELVERLAHETAAMAWGDPLREETRIGPLVGNAERDRVAALVERARVSGMEVLQPHHEQPAGGGAWYPSTIVSCDDPSHEIVQHQSFGPLLVVQEARDWDHALSLVNGVRQGLAAALFSSSAELRSLFLDGAEAGILKLNRSTADADVDVPFGGWKSSGVGPPEHGRFDRDFYTRPQVVYGA